MTGAREPLAHARVIRALGGGGPVAPPSVHARVRALARGHEPVPRRPLVLALAGVAAVGAVLVALTVMTAGVDTHTALARLAARPATEPAPTTDRMRPTLLARRFGGIPYPDWSAQFEWDAMGARTDRIAGRQADTVFYRHTHHRIAYTIVSGPPLDPPADAERVRVGRLVVHRYREGPRDVVTFVRGGRTCVLSGEVHNPRTLLKLAAWTGSGAIRARS